MWIQKAKDLYLSLFRETPKKDYFDKLNPKDATDNEIFRKIVCPYLNEKGNISTQIAITDKEKTADIMDDYFINLTKSLVSKLQL